MRIRKVEHWIVRVPFKETIHWGSGSRIGTTRLICRIEVGGGIIGWGETLCLIDTVPAVFEHAVKPAALGWDVRNTESFYRRVLGAGYYHHKRAAVMAIAAMEMAMWDAKGKLAGLPLWALWGGRYRSDVEAAAYTFTRDPEALKDRLTAFRDQGFESFKVKIGFDAASDISLARAARNAIGEHHLRLDVNGAWTPGTARRQLAKLAELDLAYVEQPLELDDLAGHAALRQAQTVPIALDESAYTLQDVSNIVMTEAADVVLLDPHQAGGLWPVIKAAGICEARGIPVTLHSGAELAVSQAAYIHLAAAIPNLSLAIDNESPYLDGDVAENAPLLHGNTYPVSDFAGLGVEADLDALEEFEVAAITGAYLDQEKPEWFPVKPSY